MSLRLPDWRISILLLILAWALVMLLACPFGAWAEEPATAPTPASAPCDSATRACLSTEKWALALRAWAPGGESRDLAGGRLQAEVRWKRWRIQGRIDGVSTAGQYKSGDLSSVRDVEAHLAVVRDVVELPGDVHVGVMAAVGGAAALPEKGITASLGRHVTAVLGVAGSWKGGRIHVGVGAVHPLERGIGAGLTWQVPLGDRVASLGYIAYGRLLMPGTDGAAPRSQAGIVAWTGVGVRL